MKHETFKAELGSLHLIRDFVEQTLADEGVPRSIVSDLILAIDEAATNIIVHGYKRNTGDIQVTAGKKNNQCVITLIDSAPAYNPLCAPAVDMETSPEERDNPGGFGVYLISRMVDKIDYCRLEDEHNRLTLMKDCSLVSA